VQTFHITLINTAAFFKKQKEHSILYISVAKKYAKSFRDFSKIM